MPSSFGRLLKTFTKHVPQMARKAKLTHILSSYKYMLSQPTHLHNSQSCRNLFGSASNGMTSSHLSANYELWIQYTYQKYLYSQWNKPASSLQWYVILYLSNNCIIIHILMIVSIFQYNTNTQIKSTITHPIIIQY